jgi:hypothetical protein
MAKGAIMRDIFISYRRKDSADVTGRIFDRMKEQFGEDRLFKDVDSIPLGKDFRVVISKAVGRCKVLLAVIGKDWLKITLDDGRRRIDDPNDYVHIEIATALKRGIPVIPVLVESTALPRSAELPKPLRRLAFHNAAPVRSDPDFHHDIERLFSELTKYLPKRRITQYGKFGASAPSGVVVRFWIKQLPKVPGEDAGKLFNNALGSWQAVVVTPMRQADSPAEANVIIRTSSEVIAVADVGPPTSKTLTIRFGSTVRWTRRTFEAASCRMIGHILGLKYSTLLGQIMSDPATVELESLPLTPQSDDIRRVREIWG